MAFSHSRFGDIEIDHGLDSSQQDSLVGALSQAGGTRGLDIPLGAAWSSHPVIYPQSAC